MAEQAGDFARWAVAAGIASASVAAISALRGERAGWSLAAIIVIAVWMARDPGGAELNRLINTIFGPGPATGPAPHERV